jgi:hypothetical protein
MISAIDECIRTVFIFNFRLHECGTSWDIGKGRNLTSATIFAIL